MRKILQPSRGDLHCSSWLRQNQNSLPRLTKVAMEICKDCEDEGKKTDKHPECKAIAA